MTLSELRQVVLVQVERRVEGLEDQVKDLTREVDGLDLECDHSCDCNAYDLLQMEDDIDQLQETVRIMLENQEALLKRITELEAGLED